MAASEEPGGDRPSGPDLARRALQAARAAAARRRESPQPAARVQRRRGGATGREVVALGQVLNSLSADLGWVQPVAGADLVEQWAHLVGPDFAERVQAERYELDSGVLHLVTDSSAHAAHLRLQQRDVVDWLNHQLVTGDATARVVRSLNVSFREHRTRRGA